jgi:hypothetical protein
MATLQHTMFLQATGQLVFHQPVSAVISGWQRYGDRVSGLPLAEQAKVNQLAELIVSSFAQRDLPPFRHVEIVGHADKDAKGPGWEDTVAANRAEAVLEALTDAVRSLWEERGMGPPPQEQGEGNVDWQLSSKGATQMIAPPYHAENRRVEVTLTRDGPPLPLPDNLPTRVARFNKLLERRGLRHDASGNATRRARCLMGKMSKPVELDLYVDGLKSGGTVGRFAVPNTVSLAGWPGNYDPPPLPDAEFLKFLGRVSRDLMGSNFAPALPDDDILDALEILIQRIDQGIIQVERYITNQRDIAGNYRGDNTRGMRLSSIFADHLNDDSSIYSCWKDFHGND